MSEGQPRTSLADRLKAMNGAPTAAAAIPVPPAAPAAAPAPAAPAAAAPVAPERKLNIVTTPLCGGTTQFFPGVTCTLVPHTGKHESRASNGGVVSWDERTMLLGPSDDWKALETAPAAPVAAVLPPDAPARTSTPAEVAAVNAPKKRTSKADKEAAAAAAAATAPAAAPAAPAATTIAPAATPVDRPLPMCQLEDLYVDCYPVKGGGSDPGLGEDILSGLALAAADAAGIPDWRLIEFGKGKGAMAAILRERLGSVPKVLVVSSSTPGSDVLMEVLAPFAKRVVRALKG